MVSIQDCEIESGCISGGLMTILITGEITSGPDSDNGDPISFCAVWTGQVGAAADEGAAAEAATGGGSAEMQVSTLPILASATVEDAAYIEIVGGTKYSFGPLTASAPPNASSSDQMTAQIDAVIGDTLVISLSSAAAVATPFEGSASGSTLIELNFNVGPCGQPTSVPTTPWSGIVVLLAGLLALGGVLLRRRSSDTGR